MAVLGIEVEQTGTLGGVQVVPAPRMSAAAPSRSRAEGRAEDRKSDDAEVIVRHVIIAYGLTFAVMACLSVVDNIAASPFLQLNLVARAVTLAFAGIILALGLRGASLHSSAVATLGFCAVILGSTIWQASFTHEAFATPMAGIGLALVAAWSLPWPVAYQAALAALAAAAITMNAAPAQRIGDETVVPILLALSSIPMALLGRRQRAALAAAKSEARQAGEQLHQIAESADEVLWVLDLASSTMAYLSPGIEQLCGVSAEAMRGDFDVFLRLVPEDERGGVSAQIAAARTTHEPARIDHRIRRPDGTLRWVQLRLAPIRNEVGDVVRVGGVIRDTTAEWELADAQARAREEAETTARLKDQFLANLSHEIRTPLNGVIGMIDLLRESILVPAQRAHVETVHACGKQLLSLVNDLLDFAKIEAGKQEVGKTDFDVGEIVAYAVQLFAARAAEKGLDLSHRIDLPPFAAFRGDPEILRQILTNLVANAVKFTESGRVEVRAGLAEDLSGQIRLQFEVEDTGIGVAPAAIGEIFAPFIQADASTARRFGGTGLGLAIAQRLAKLMDGQIQCRSTVGSGSTFWFTVLVEPAGADAADGSRLPSQRVLVVATSPQSRTCLSAELNGWALRVHQVSSFDDALAAVDTGMRRSEPYDLVIADMGTSGMTAAEFIREVRQTAAECPPAVGLISSGGRPQDGPAACEAGAAFYLHVPVRPWRLFESLRVLWEPGGMDDLPRVTQASRRILVVEDNLLNQRVAVAMVERVGHRAEVVASGREALQALENGRFDAVLMDCQLPDLDGFETTVRIRERERGTGRRIPVIALTASATQAAREQCLAAGMDDYLTKPIQRPLLGEVLGRWISAQDVPTAADGPAPIVDRVRLYDLTNGDPVQLERYTRMFHAEISWGLREIRDGAKDSDSGRVLSALHRLKGAAACVGANGVLAAVAHIEETAGVNNCAHVGDASKTIEEAYRVYAEALGTSIHGFLSAR